MSDQEKAAKRAQWEEINRAKAAAKEREREAKSSGPTRFRTPQAVRGTRDLLPPETALWNRVEHTAREVFGKYGFGEIRPPIFEATELFARGVGGETDIVSKEMYTFEDYELPDLVELRTAAVTFPGPFNSQETFVQFTTKVGLFLLAAENAFKVAQIPKTPENERTLQKARELITTLNLYQNQGDRELLPRVGELKDTIRQVRFGDVISLRPEATASVCRAYIEHSMYQWPQPVKLFYMGPMFRRERPQKGRYRQFYQIGAEVLEVDRRDESKDAMKELVKDAATDAEVIDMLMTYFNRVGLQGAELSINSIGHAADNCRRAYVDLLRNKLREVKDQLDVDSQRRIETNPLRVLDSKLENEQAIIATLPHIADHLCADCKEHYAELQRQLDARGVKYRENWRLVRGLDYYTRTTFEITSRGLGSQNAVCGGGRYDGLVELLGGPPTKGIGFAIGEDRLIMSLQSQGIEVREGADVLIAWQDRQSQSQAQSLASLLREAGLSVVVPTKAMRPGEGIGLANKLGIPVGAVIGPHEASAGIFTIKIMSEGTQAELPQNAAAEVGRFLLFRILLEKNLSKVAANHGIPSLNRPAFSLLQDLTVAGLVSPDVAQLIKSSMQVLNRVAHGDQVTDEERTSAISQALFVLYRMSMLQMMAS